MGKLIVPLIIGLLMGISGGGFFAVYKASAAHATAVLDAKKHGLKPLVDSTQIAEGDSTAHGDGEHAASDSSGGEHAAAEPKAAGHDSTPTTVAAAGATPHAEPAHVAGVEHAAATHTTPAIIKPVTPITPVAAAAHGAATPTPTPTTAAAAAASAVTPTVAETEAHQRRLAKIFASMSPKDASRVLTQMTDHDVGIILGLLSDRQAAAILTSLPAPRAAALSQLQPRRGGGTQ